MQRHPNAVAVTCGDPSGIGPEIAYAAWEQIGTRIPFFLIGDPRHLPARAKFVEISDPSKAETAASTGLPVLVHTFPHKASPGTPHPENAAQVVRVIERAVELVQSGSASAISTAPISKKELVDHAGFEHPGHTEFLASLGGIDRAVMMLASEKLRVVPTTIHIPLKDVPENLTSALLESTIRTTHAALITDFGISGPRLAVSGLNPHAGEGGMLGGEDATIIKPVCEKLKAEGMDIKGPLPADTMFHASARATYDAAIAMYHDQALVPIKTLDFDLGVNVTLGLQFIRTSPDHGTAYDIAGQGLANPSSMIESIKLANQMAMNRHSV